MIGIMMQPKIDLVIHYDAAIYLYYMATVMVRKNCEISFQDHLILNGLIYWIYRYHVESNSRLVGACEVAT